MNTLISHIARTRHSCLAALAATFFSLVPLSGTASAGMAPRGVVPRQHAGSAVARANSPLMARNDMSGAATWIWRRRYSLDAWLYGIACPTRTTCLAVGSGTDPSSGNPTGIVLETTDGGARWQRRLAAPNMSLF